MTKKPANSGKIQGNAKFKPGQSGNPAGKPKGTRHRITLLAEKLMEDEAEDVITAVIEAAKGGDMKAARLIVDRILPVRRSRPVSIDLPRIVSAEDVAKSQAAIVEATSLGQLDLDEATALSNLVEARRRSIETVELEARLTRLEKETIHA